jgi:transposase
MQKTTGNKGKSGSRYTHEMSFMRAVVKEYEQSDLSIRQLAKKYLLGYTQLQQWTKKFSSQLAQETPALMTPEEQQQLEALRKQNEEPQKKLNLANLKITGLEMMIDIAEEELKIDIRKKPGTKQSED